MREVSTDRQQFLFSLVVVLCAAFMTSQFSYRLRADTAEEQIAAAYNTLEGKPDLPEFQNRLLFPVLLKLARMAAPSTVSDVNLWKALRLFSALIAFSTVFYCIQALTQSRIRALVGCVFLAYGYLWTVTTHQWEHATDFFDLAFISCFVLFALRKQYALLLAATLLGSFNRESAAFSGVILIGHAAATERISRASAWKFLIGLVCIAIAFSTVMLARAYFRGAPSTAQQLGLLTTLKHWRWLLLPYGAGTALIAMLAPLGLALRNCPAKFSSDQRGLLWGCLGCLTITSVFGIAYELRVMLPCYLLLIFVLVLDRSSRHEGAWLAGLLGGGPGQDEES